MEQPSHDVEIVNHDWTKFAGIPELIKDGKVTPLAPDEPVAKIPNELPCKPNPETQQHFTNFHRKANTVPSDGFLGHLFDSNLIVPPAYMPPIGKMDLKFTKEPKDRTALNFKRPEF